MSNTNLNTDPSKIQLKKIYRNEIWKPIPDFPGYEISNRGRVKSYKTSGYSQKLAPTAKILKTVCAAGGYRQISLCHNKGKYTKLIHRLVLETFIGPCPIKMEACHNDGNKSNNHVTNLRWDTSTNNYWDSRKHGNSPIGSKHGMSKLTEEQIIKIRELSNQLSQVKIGELFGVGQDTIHLIVSRKHWRHV